MLRDPPSLQYEIEMVTLDELVCQGHFLRKIDKRISFEVIRGKGVTVTLRAYVGRWTVPLIRTANHIAVVQSRKGSKGSGPQSLTNVGFFLGGGAETISDASSVAKMANMLAW